MATKKDLDEILGSLLKRLSPANQKVLAVALKANKEDLLEYAMKLVHRQQLARMVHPLANQHIPHCYRDIARIIRRVAVEAKSQYGPARTWPIAWYVEQSLTIHHPAIKSLPWGGNWIYQQDFLSPLVVEQPTTRSLIFMVPDACLDNQRGNPYHVGDIAEQRELLADNRRRHGLPDHYFTSFGGAGLLAALIHRYKQVVGHKIPYAGLWIHTDTTIAKGVLGDHEQRFVLGGNNGTGLCLEQAHRWVEKKLVSYFHLAVEPWPEPAEQPQIAEEHLRQYSLT